MKRYAGLDVSIKETAICVVDEKRKVVREGKVGSEFETIAAWTLPLSGISCFSGCPSDACAACTRREKE